MNILLAEDDTDLRSILSQYLEINGFTVLQAENGKVGLETFRSEHVDFCILDIMMPVMDGWELARQIRKADKDMPVVFLTARNQKEDRIKGLKLGADDYITKPFEVEELILRIQNILRRSGHVGARPVPVGNFEFRFDELTLAGFDHQHQMTLKEAEFLKYLVENSNQVIKREQILEDLWGENDYFLGRSMDVFVTRLRKYLKPDESISLDTIRGVGFILRVN
ncbi:MAG TPA: response regulator transcription factor [Bacteroides sp.]|nr:response regulator transcription factor [Bacteroides sp.]